MNTKILITIVFVTTAMTIAFFPAINAWTAQASNVDEIHDVTEPPKIQLAILLDTSGSMDGLINQTREQLWQVVNEFATSSQDDRTPTLEVAVFEYGNTGIPATDGHVRMVSNLTPELDQVSEALFSLTTNGGDEFCGYAIRDAVTKLNWSNSDRDIRAIFIAGNESFNQGPVLTADAIAMARQRGIVVNTIHAGGETAGVNDGWQVGAALAGGDFMNIDHNHQIVHRVAPQDTRIAELNRELNETYVPYGDTGAEKQSRQDAEDKKSLAVSAGYLAERAIAKVSKLYDNSSWDLVDAISNENVDLATLAPSALPTEMQAMSGAERDEYVQQKTEQRRQIQAEIQALKEDRELWEAEQEPVANEATIDEAIVRSVHKLGEQKNFEFEG